MILWWAAVLGTKNGLRPSRRTHKLRHDLPLKKSNRLIDAGASTPITRRCCAGSIGQLLPL